MTLKEILNGTSNWLRGHRFERGGQCEPMLDDDGLLTMPLDPDDEFPGHEPAASERAVMVNTVTPLERREPIERLQEGFHQLIDQLDQINDHLGRQVEQHEELMGRVRQLPHLLETLPSAVENQKQLTAQLLDQLKVAAVRDRLFIETVERIPTETVRQTDALIAIDHQLSAAAETDVQLAESFNKFRLTLDRLNHNTISNTEGILQMSKTFAASDRYLKYVISKLNKRYAWTFAVALSVCVAVISALVGVIVYVAR